MQFLTDIKANNNRVWFADNKARFQTIYEAMKGFAAVMHTIISNEEPIEYMRVKRIYRDLRFSKDRTPYRTFLGSYFRRKSKVKSSYYLQIEPGCSYLEGSFREINSIDLKQIREVIAADSQPLQTILDATNFKANFDKLRGETVKTSPRGYKINHPAIHLLRHKEFILRKSFTDDVVLADDFLETILNTYRAMQPFFKYMDNEFAKKT